MGDTAGVKPPTRAPGRNEEKDCPRLQGGRAGNSDGFTPRKQELRIFTWKMWLRPLLSTKEHGLLQEGEKKKDREHQKQLLERLRQIGEGKRVGVTAEPAPTSPSRTRKKKKERTNSFMSVGRSLVSSIGTAKNGQGSVLKRGGVARVRGGEC